MNQKRWKCKYLQIKRASIQYHVRNKLVTVKVNNKPTVDSTLWMTKQDTFLNVHRNVEQQLQW